ncbi:MAG: phosphatase PAP2 family protein [Bacteroidales bacterium]|nr:phosphatase PAP2 family protein [Bacteroidales bacterium]
MLHRLFILPLLLFAFIPCLEAQEPDSFSDTLPATLVWQRPLPSIAVGSAFVVGISPVFFDAAHRQNILVREEIQLWRRNAFNHSQLHFDNFVQYLPLLSVEVLDLVGVPSRHSSWPLLRRTVGGVVVTSAIVIPLKHIVDEWRPDRGASNSFPSGHTAFSFAGAELLRLEYGQHSWVIPAVGYSVASFTGFMRLYNDRHWLGDVLGGAAIGVVAADVSYYLNGFVDDFFSSRKKHPVSSPSLEIE